MITLSKFSNFPDELSENDELREYKLSRSDCTTLHLLCHGSSREPTKMREYLSKRNIQNFYLKFQVTFYHV